MLLQFMCLHGASSGNRKHKLDSSSTNYYENKRFAVYALWYALLYCTAILRYHFKVCQFSRLDYSIFPFERTASSQHEVQYYYIRRLFEAHHVESAGTRSVYNRRIGKRWTWMFELVTTVHYTNKKLWQTPNCSLLYDYVYP